MVLLFSYIEVLLILINKAYTRFPNFTFTTKTDNFDRRYDQVCNTLANQLVFDLSVLTNPPVNDDVASIFSKIR